MRRGGAAKRRGPLMRRVYMRPCGCGRKAAEAADVHAAAAADVHQAAVCACGCGRMRELNLAHVCHVNVYVTFTYRNNLWNFWNLS